MKEKKKPCLITIRQIHLRRKIKIYSEILHPALTKMVESIIRRYRLYIPDEEMI